MIWTAFWILPESTRRDQSECWNERMMWREGQCAGYSHRRGHRRRSRMKSHCKRRGGHTIHGVLVWEEDDGHWWSVWAEMMCWYPPATMVCRHRMLCLRLCAVEGIRAMVMLGAMRVGWSLCILWEKILVLDLSFCAILQHAACLKRCCKQHGICVMSRALASDYCRAINRVKIQQELMKN